MQRSQRWSFEQRHENALAPDPAPPNEEEIMRQPTMLSLEEAEVRASRSVGELEEVINRVDGTPGKRDEDRQAKLNSLFMTFLAERYGIAAPDSTRDEVDRE